MRPIQKYYDVTIGSAQVSITVELTEAIDYYQGIVHIISVDELETVTESGKRIGVIS